MTHNYYLYNKPDEGLLTWIPWDNNEALQDGKQGGALSLSLNEVGSGWPLISYLMDVSEYEQSYQEFLSEFIDGAFAPEKNFSRNCISIRISYWKPTIPKSTPPGKPANRYTKFACRLTS